MAQPDCPANPAEPPAMRRQAAAVCCQAAALARRCARGLGALAAGLGLALSVGPARAQAQVAGKPVLQLRIVGGLAGLNQYTRHEEPFWTRQLPALTQGRVRAEIVPFDRAGIRGQDMLRLLQLGVVPFGTALMSLAMAQDALVGLPDLPGANPDMATLRRSVAAFRPLLAEHLQQRHGIQLLAVYAYPAQMLFCRQPFQRLADLAQRRVRVSSVTQADFVEALGAVAVYTPFAEMLPQVRSGALDCAITGSMSGNTIGLHEATSHLQAMPINWGLSLFAANQAAWNGLPADLRAQLQQQLPLLEQAVWAEAERETGEGIACNAGSPACSRGRPGRMVVVPPAAADPQRVRELLAGTLLPRLMARCGAACASAWNQTLAPVVGVPAAPAR